MRTPTWIVSAAALSLLIGPALTWAEDTVVATQPIQPDTQPAEDAVALDPADLSYALGCDFATRLAAGLRSEGIDVDPDAFAKAVADVLGDREPAMTPDQVRQTLFLFQTQQLQKMQAAAADNASAGEAFLTANAKNDGVKTTASGLQYKVVKEGEGDSPAETDTVKVDYEGKLLDGTVFDSSYARGEPVEFALNQVIPGWTEGLQLMTPGSKYELYIPAELAYGPQGAGNRIPPNSTLIFTVELHEVK